MCAMMRKTDDKRFTINELHNDIHARPPEHQVLYVRQNYTSILILDCGLTSVHKCEGSAYYRPYFSFTFLVNARSIATVTSGLSSAVTADTVLGVGDARPLTMGLVSGDDRSKLWTELCDEDSLALFLKFDTQHF
jgi:hypothetical protein